MCCGQINVKDSPYGATGNGTTDDRNAIQSAIDAAAMAFGGGVYLRIEVCIPAGNYRCDSGLTIPYGLSLVGHAGGTVLNFSNAGSSVTAIQWGTSAQDVSHGVLSGLTIYGPGTTTSSIGVMVGDTSQSGSNKTAHCAIRDCFIRDFGTGVRLGTNCFANEFENLRIGYNGKGLAMPNSPVNFGVNLLFVHCAFDENSQHFDVNPGNGGEGLVFRHCTFSYANTVPEAIVGAGYTVLFDKCSWYSDQGGSSGQPLLMDIVYPVDFITFQDSVFSVATPAGVPICWNSGAWQSPCRIKFDCCVVMNLGTSAYFYGSVSTYSSIQPTALAIQSPGVTAASGKITRVDA